MTIDFERRYLQPRRGVINSMHIMSSLRDLEYGNARVYNRFIPSGLSPAVVSTACARPPSINLSCRH